MRLASASDFQRLAKRKVGRPEPDLQPVLEFAIGPDEVGAAVGLHGCGKAAWFTLGDGAGETQRYSITIASSPLRVHPSQWRPQSQRRPMSVASLLQPSVRVARLLPLLASTGCSVVPDREIAYDGRPCNVWCQRWMGVGPETPSVLAPVPPSIQDVRPRAGAHQAGVGGHGRRLVERSAPHTPATHGRSRIVPGASPPEPNLVAIPTATPPNALNRQLPGSSETLPGNWTPSR